MNDISTNLSKLNIFQKMKLRIWQNSNKINMKSYSKQPQYIKYDETIIQKIVEYFYYNKISEEELLRDIKTIEKKQAIVYYQYLNKIVTNNYDVYKNTKYSKYFIMK